MLAFIAVAIVFDCRAERLTRLTRLASRMPRNSAATPSLLQSNSAWKRQRQIAVTAAYLSLCAWFQLVSATFQLAWFDATDSACGCFLANDS